MEYNESIQCYAKKAYFVDFDTLEFSLEKCPNCKSDKLEIVLSGCGIMISCKTHKINRLNILKDSFYNNQVYVQCVACEWHGWEPATIE